MTSVRAQITPDNSLGAENSNINPDSIQGISFDRIGGGATRGANLFHSFQEFNVNNGQLVYFSNPAGIANILTRVTGINRSNILGTLGVLGNANLFLINPNGIFFGPNASLDLGGSFFGSSANSLLFDNGFEFSATNPQAPPLLTVNIPIGLRFRDSPGEISVQGLGQNNGLAGISSGFNNPTLEVPVGQNLTLVGGNVNLDGGVLQATGGRVQLGGLTAAGTVGINANQTLNFPDGVTRGDVSLTNRAGINVIANQLGGGSIDINARNIGISGLSLLTAGIASNLETANNSAGNITLNATGETRINQSRIENNVNTGTIANGGNIGITTGSFVMNLGDLNSTNFGSGSAGDISLNARNEVSINSTNVFSNVTRNGQGGDITIKAGSFSLLDGSPLQSSVRENGQGNGGNVRIDVPTGTVRIVGRDSDGNSSSIFSDVLSGASGNAGNIIINAGSIFTDNALLRARNEGNGSAGNISLQVSDAIALTNGTQISSSIFGTGNAGNITVQASGTVRIAGSDLDGNSSGIFSDVLSEASGNAGNIFINAGSIFTDDALLRARNQGNGSAGNISLQVGDAIALTNATQISSSISGTGNAGNVTLRAENGDISFAGSDIFSTVESGGIGNAGKIDIITRNLSLTDGSQLQTLVRAGQQGNAGNITVQASGTVRIAGRDSDGIRSGIFSDVLSGASGNAGNVTINAGSISTDDASLRARNEGNGSAGNISLQAGDAIALTNGSVINSSISGTGNAGDVTLRAENGDISFAGGSDIFSTVESGGMGNAGKIDIITRNLSLTDGSQLQTLVRAGQENNAGNITVQASGTVRIAGRDSDGIRSGIFSEVQSGASGDGGSITINANSIFTDDALLRARNTGNGSAGNISLQVGDAIALTNGSSINSSISGRGNAGDVTLRAENGDISLAGDSDIFSTVESGGMGNAGKIDITTRNLTLTDGAQLQTLVRAGQENNAGNITVQASGTVRIAGRDSDGNRSGIFSDVLSGASGNAGNVTINASSIFTDDALLRARNTGNGSAGNISLQVGDAIALTNGSQISSSIFGTGNAGNVTLRTENGDISLAGDSDIFSTVGSGGTGNAGGIDITTGTLSLKNGASLSVITSGMGDAGIVKIQASDISLDGVGSTGFSSGIFSTVQGNAVGNAGGIDITTGTLSLFNGAIINASTFATGDAGTVKIQASDSIFASGVGSNTVTSGIRSNVQQNAIGNAGGIQISTKNLSFTNGAQIIANTLSNGNAGNVTISASDRVSFTGVNSGIFANTASGSTGNGGNITIQQEQNRFPTIAISDGAEVTVDSQGQGQGGNLSITGNSLTLDRGIINASTQSANGGNINLTLRNFIRLRNESLISANAGGQQGGNGGNITINSPFIVAFPQNNDITANAGNGSGGQVIINATLFGIAPLSAADLQRLRPDDLDPRQLPTSDITAISRDNPSLSLPVQVDSPDVDPSRGLVELPETVTDTTQQVAQNPCRQGLGNEFVVTGRGGLPTTPNETLSSDNVRVDLLQPVASSGNSPSANIKPATTVTARRVPAQGWIFNDKDQVVLTAYDPTNTDSQRSFRTAAACPAR